MSENQAQETEKPQVAVVHQLIISLNATGNIGVSRSGPLDLTTELGMLDIAHELIIAPLRRSIMAQQAPLIELPNRQQRRAMERGAIRGGRDAR